MRIYLLLAIFLFLAGCLLEAPGGITKLQRVETGDVVMINYIQQVEGTGELVATSYAEIANDPNVPKAEGYKEPKSFGPINITVGIGLMPTMDDALIGMRIGEVKRVLIPPEEAYGERLEELIRVIPRVAVLPKITEVPTGEFNRTLVEGEYVKLRYWRARVVEVTEDYVALRNEPRNGSIVQTKYGPAVVIVNDTHVVSILAPEVGVVVETPFGPAKIIAYDEETVTLDHNHPLAGKAISLEFKVVGIEKSK
jgi:FKBP-type peptidyl-prolyl cis-trans isomerase 2